MIKPLVILFNTISVFLFSFFFGDTPVTITGSFPKNVKTDTEFSVDITINKGSIGGFAKFQLEVPQGFTVKESDSKSGNFTFANNIAKIIWTSTPNDAEFTIKFMITADASAVGLKTIAAKYSFVNNNNKEIVEMTPAEVMVEKNVITAVPIEAVAETPTVQPVTTPPAEITKTDVKIEPVVPVTPTENPTDVNSTNVTCMRKITPINANEHTVEVRIKKSSLKGFAKFQELIPVGYAVKSINTSGSSFSVSDGKAKFVWVSLPVEEELLIAYKLEKGDLNTKNEAKLENGEFSYIENDQTKKVKLPVEPLPANSGAVVANNPSGNETTNLPKTQEEPKKDEAPIETAVKATSEPVNAGIAKKEGNIFYCVQIGAFRNAIQSDVLAKKFNINEKIKSEMSEGFNKFTVGNFDLYKDARSHREGVKQKGCNGAFVAAYNNGKRITVQEALMITSQKWFK